jgi:hypothetical protein
MVGRDSGIDHGVGGLEVGSFVRWTAYRAGAMRVTIADGVATGNPLNSSRISERKFRSNCEAGIELYHYKPKTAHDGIREPSFATM